MRLLATALVCLLLAGVPAQAQTTAKRARDAAAAEKQLVQTRASIKKLADEQRRLDDQRGEAGKAVREADAKVSAAQASLRATNAKLQAEEKALAQLQARRAALEDSLSRQRAELATLIRSAYALGKHEQLKLLLEQDRMSDLARVLAYHRYFQRDRQARITGLNAELRSLAELGESIAARQLELLAVRDRQQAEVQALAAQRQSRTKLLASIDASYRDRGTRLNALGRNEKETAALLERLRKVMAQLPRPKPVAQRPSKPGSKSRPIKPGSKPRPTSQDAAIPLGPLRLPLAGTVLAGFGGMMPDGHRSNGLLIAGTAGAQVQAVRAGRVAYADWLKGYGLLMILDHGNGWMTLYAFNDALLRNTGDSVQAGEAISTVGSSGGQGRAALYFELRRNGQAQDPRSWLKP